MTNILYKLEDDFSSLTCFFDNSVKMLNDILVEASNINDFNINDFSHKIIEHKRELESYFVTQRSSLKINRHSFDNKIVDEVVYLSVCLFDDILIHQRLLKSSLWNDFPLEKLIFSTSSGGHVIFDKIDELLAYSNYEKRVELSKLYYSALKVGFLGKYRDNNDPIREKYCQKLNDIYLKTPIKENTVEPPSFMFSSNKYDKYIKKESIYLIFKCLFIFIISLFLIGEIYWLFVTKILLNIR